MSTHDEWKETWDWAQKIWGETPEGDYSFNWFFGKVASIRAEEEGWEEVGSSDVWHISYGAVSYAKKTGVDSREALVETVLDDMGVWGIQKKVLVATYV